MSDVEENPPTCSSPSFSCSLSTLLGTFSGTEPVPMGRRSIFAKSGFDTRRGDKGHVVRKLFTADHRPATEVIELSSDEEMDTSDMEFLEEVIDVSDGDDSECEVLQHVVMGKSRRLMSEVDDEGDGTSYPMAGPKGDDDGSSFVGLGFGPVSPFPVGSPLAGFHAMSSHEMFGSGEADLLASDDSNDGGDFGFDDSEEMTVGILPIRSEPSNQDGVSPDKSEVSAAITCEVGGLVHRVQEGSMDQGNQEVQIVQGEQDELNNDAGRDDDVIGSSMTGLDRKGQKEAFDAMQVVPVVPHVVITSPDDPDCSVDDQPVPDQDVLVSPGFPKISGPAAASSD